MVDISIFTGIHRSIWFTHHLFVRIFLLSISWPCSHYLVSSFLPCITWLKFSSTAHNRKTWKTISTKMNFSLNVFEFKRLRTNPKKCTGTYIHIRERIKIYVIWLIYQKQQQIPRFLSFLLWEQERLFLLRFLSFICFWCYCCCGKFAPICFFNGIVMAFLSHCLLPIGMSITMRCQNDFKLHWWKIMITQSVLYCYGFGHLK